MDTITTPPLRELAARVRKGSVLLDKKMPGWRGVLRRVLAAEQRQLQMRDPDMCVLGTIEHNIGLLRRRPILPTKAAKQMSPEYARGERRLRLNAVTAREHGFFSTNCHEDSDAVYQILDELWRGEIEAGV